MKHHNQKQFGRGRGGEIDFTHRSMFIIKSSEGRSLEEGADAEDMEGAAYWLVHRGLLSLFLTQDQKPRNGTTHNGLNPSITNLKNAGQACLQPFLMEVFSQLRSPPDDSMSC